MPRRVYYQTKKVVRDGIRFDSQREAQRYTELKLMEGAGAISQLELQPKYMLQPSFVYGDKRIRAINYIADFRYTENGRMVVEDVKGFETTVFKLKWKMALAKYPEIDWRLT